MAQVVILAGGSGDRLSPLCETIPKPLLPIKNRPMLFHQLDYVKKEGFKQVLLATLSKWTDSIKQAVEEWRGASESDFQVDVVAGPDEGDTADAIRACAEKLQKDFLVIGCDCLTSISLRAILDRYKQLKKPTCLVVAKQIIPNQRREGTFKNEVQETEYTGYDERTGRLLYLLSSGYVPKDGTVRFGKNFLLARPRMTLTTALHDQHIYVFQDWVVDFLQQKPAITSLKHELIPLLVHQQLRRRREDGTWGDLGYTIPTLKAVSAVDFDNLPERSKDFIEEFNDDMRLMTGAQSTSSDDLRCCIHILTTADLLESRTFAMRANYLSTYYEINKEMLREKGAEGKKPDNLPPRVQIGDDCLIGPEFESGECVTIKGSLLGAGCRLGSNVRISNSILMDGVIIEDQVKIANCIIASTRTVRTRIGSECSLKDCQIDAGYQMKNGYEAADEKLVSEKWDDPAEGEGEDAAEGDAADA